ncbi:MAG: GNAT family protein [Ktedonobacterales bacterium]
MPYTFHLMTEADAHTMLTWRYPEPYAIYSSAADAPRESAATWLREFLDRRSPYYAVREEGAAPDSESVGFVCFGSSAEVGGELNPDMPPEPHIFRADGAIAIGLGMRPDLTGKGQGAAFLRAALAFGRATYHPRLFRLFVFEWNARAIKVYERAGFKPVGQVAQPMRHGEPRIFLEMAREED